MSSKEFFKGLLCLFLDSPPKYDLNIKINQENMRKVTVEKFIEK